MRTVYLDESGIGNVAHEPHLVVVGVIVDADRKWKEVELYFRELTEEIFDGDDYGRFVFHAKDIWHGAGRFWSREKWSRKDRMRVLRRLVQVPKLFELPVAVSTIDRAEYAGTARKRVPTITDKNLNILCHAETFLGAVQMVDFWMKKNAPDEVAMLFAEDTADVKATIARIHDGYTDPTMTHHEEAFRSDHIVDAVHFVKKQESILLQIADHCAFICRRQMAGKADVQELFELLRPQVRQDYHPKTKYAIKISPHEIQLVS